MTAARLHQRAAHQTKSTALRLNADVGSDGGRLHHPRPFQVLLVSGLAGRRGPPAPPAVQGCAPPPRSPVRWQATWGQSAGGKGATSRRQATGQETTSAMVWRRAFGTALCECGGRFPCAHFSAPMGEIKVAAPQCPPVHWESKGPKTAEKRAAGTDTGSSMRILQPFRLCSS